MTEEKRMSEYQKEAAERRARRELNFPAQVACLDPTVAARVASQRPLFNFEVSYTHPKNGKFVSEVVAENEADAWATFCDENNKSDEPKKNTGYPSPKMPGRKIKRLGPVQAPQVI